MFIDATAAPAFPGTFELAGTFSGGFAPVVVDGKLGYVDRAGRLAVPAADGVNLLLDRAGKRTPLPPEVQSVAPFDDGLAEVRLEDGGWGYVDAEGRLVWSRGGGRPRLRP